MMPGQHIYALLKSVKGQHVPLSHIVAVTRFERQEVMDLCSRLVSIGKVSSRYERNGHSHELHYWVEAGGKR